MCHVTTFVQQTFSVAVTVASLEQKVIIGG
jgi:hypothetical protein